jgi:predicted nucleic acid-binding protein
MGLLRLITNRAVMGENVLTLGAAWAVFEQLMSDERILFTSEPEGIEACWRQWTSGMTYAHRIWNDAYLAAFAFTGEFEFVTLDHGFRAYPGLKLTIIAN